MSRSVVALLLAGLAAADALADAPAADRIQLKDVDRSADPCTDFDAYANGPWRAAHPIPPGAQRWSRRAAAREQNRRQLTSLLQTLAARSDLAPGSAEQMVGDHFASCMDERAVEAAGASPLATLLGEIAAAQDAAGVQRTIRRLHELAIPAAFVLAGVPDEQDPARVTASIAPGGPGVPDRDHVARLLALAGSADARKTADDVVALESRLAEARLTPAAAAAPGATAHRTSFAQLKELTPRIDWDTYFAEARLPRDPVNVAEPAFLERLDRELGATPVTTWNAYLTWQLLDSASPSLSKPFADAAATPTTAREARCLESTETLLGEPLGRVYAARYFPSTAKARVEEMVRELVAALEEDLDASWASEPTRREALAKIAAYDVKVGYPDTWADTAELPIRRDAFWANVAAARRFGVAAERRRIGQRVSRVRWELPPSSPGAYIDVQLNLMGLPAGFLQPWAFDAAAPDAVDYGAIGAGIAHDVTHAIDTLGAEYDATGQPRRWWAAADREVFEKLGQCTVEQYDGYTVEPGVALRGRQVLGEALGDLAGLRIAYRALHRSMQRRAAPVVEGLTPDQQFFVAWAQFRGGAESAEQLRQMVESDAHAPSRYRVIGPLSNLPEFERAFACRAGSAMVRPPEKRCTSWPFSR